MNSHSAGLDNPQGIGHRARFQDRQEVPETAQDSRNTRARSDLQDNHARALLRRKARHLAEIMIQGDQRSTLARTNLEQPLVSSSAQALVPDGHHIVTGRLQKVQTAPADVLVELELHAYSATGTGTMRSRDTSAP